jgi:hypothetical protein
MGSGEQGGLARSNRLTPIVEWLGEIGSGTTESPKFVAQVLEKSGFEEGKLIWFPLCRLGFCCGKFGFCCARL